MKTAKPVIVMFAALAAVMLAGWIAVAALTGEGESRYVRVDDACVDASGDADMPFEYRLSAFDENGRESDVSFKTVRELRGGAFLACKVLPVRGVVSWEEVPIEDIPDPAANALSAA